jgi:hypothetical protein
VHASITPSIATSQAPGAPRYGYSWWLYSFGRDTSEYYWAGSGFGGQSPIVLPNEDMVVVFNAWSILPGQPRLPLRAILTRIVTGMTGGKVSPHNDARR